MKRHSLLFIALITLSGVTEKSVADPPKQMPIPKEAGEQLASNGWQVVCHAKLLSTGPIRPRALSYQFKYYCGKLGDPKGRLVWEYTSSGSSFRPLNIMPDGTVVGVAYSNKLLWVGPNDPPGKIGDGTAIVLPGHKSETAFLHATKSGLVVYPYDLNQTVPVYFVPLDGQKPLVDKRVELLRRDVGSYIYLTRPGFHVNDDWILWDLTAFNCQTHKRWTVPVDKKESTVLGIDGNLVVVRHEVVVDRKYVVKAITFDLATQKEVSSYPIELKTKLVAHRNGIGYFVTEIARKVGDRTTTAEAVCFDLSRQSEALFRKVIPYDARPYAPMNYTQDGFSLPGDPPQFIEWFERAKK